MRIALFALNTVLFPGGVLPLRIFEARYMDMVRDCMQTEAPFGVCLTSKGGETGRAAATENVGCLAHIGAWDMQQLGLLNLRCIGGDRFRVTERTVEANGLIRAQVTLLDADVDQELSAEHRPCAQLLQRVIDDVKAEARRAADSDETVKLPFEPPYRLDSSVWVGNRLCEVLPVPLKAKQKLMELDDAYTRLQIITQYLKQHEVL